MGVHLKSKWEWNRIISYYVVIALLVGAGGGYVVGNSPVSNLMEEKDGLEAEYDSLGLAFQSLEAELNSTQEMLVQEQRDNELLQERYLEMLEIDGENQLLKQQVIDLEAEIVRLDKLEQNYTKLKDRLMSKIGVTNLTIEPGVIELGGNVTISFYISNIMPEPVDWSFAPYIEGPDQGYSIMDCITLGSQETKKVSYVETPLVVGNYTVKIGGLTGFFEVL